MRVLVADDEEDVRDVVARALKADGHVVITAADLAAARARIASGSLEVLVGRLRRKLGSDLIRRLRGEGYSLAGSRKDGS